MFIYIVAGLTTGSIFGLAAVGVVLTYKTSGIFNFAHGALASAAAFLYYFLHVQRHVAWPIAAFLCVFVAGPGFGLILELVTRRMTLKDLPTKVVGTIGLLLAIEGLLDLLYPPGSDLQVPQFLPSGFVTIFGTTVGDYRIIIFVIGLVTVTALTVFLRLARAGVAMRAVVDDPELLDISGTSPVRTRRYAWLIGSCTAAASGVLIAPLVPLDATTLTFLIITAFGAAAIGRFTSIPLSYLGGLAIGIAQSFLERYILNSTGLAGGLSGSLPFLILFVLLIVSPKLRRPSSAKIVTRDPSVRWRFPYQFRIGGLVISLVILLAAPTFVGGYLVDWTRTLAYVVVFLSLGLLVKASGQVSLAHVSFMAIGVCGFSYLAYVHHWPWLLAFLVAGAIAAPVGALLAIPAIRFPGLYLALATLGFGFLLEQMFYSQSYMFGAYGLGTNVPSPHVSWLGLVGPKGLYYVALLVVLLVAGLVMGIDGSRLGRLLKAMGDSPKGLESVGTSINVSRVLVFAIAASLAAIGGILDAAALGIVGPANYAPLLSLQLFAVVMITVGGAPWYAVAAAVAQVLIPSYLGLSADVGYAFTLFFGVSAMAYASTPASVLGVPSIVRRFVDRRLGPSAASDSNFARPAFAVAPAIMVPTELAVNAITVRYGGNIAARDISLQAVPGRVTGLIGPNGAGKTTVFNAIAGLVKVSNASFVEDNSVSGSKKRASSGRIVLGGDVIDRKSTASRARRGLGRTFQQMELFDSLTVWDNVGLGYEGAKADLNPLRHLISRRSERSEMSSRVSWALELCGIAEIADREAASLSTGQRRLVEMARCLAGDFGVLLLDEPSSGLDHTETRTFGAVLRRIVSERNLTVLLVEHDMALVNQLCDDVYVVDFGQHLFKGTPEEVGCSPIVRSAYLGELVSGDTLNSVSQVRHENASSVHEATNQQMREVLVQQAPVLEVRSLTSGYGRTAVIRDVSLRVEAGQVVAVLGANGAGKTTLLRSISGVLRQMSGEILLDGKNIEEDAPNKRAGKGLCSIPEGRGVFRTLTVAENLRLQLPAKKSNEAIERCLEVFPALRSRMSEIAGNLSGGQQQMLALGRSYLSDPRIVLLDEVSMGLAPIAVDAMFEAIEGLSRSGTALLLVEQYVNRAIAMADSVVLLRKGEIEFSGLASQLNDAVVLQSYLGVEAPLATVTNDAR